MVLMKQANTEFDCDEAEDEDAIDDDFWYDDADDDVAEVEYDDADADFYYAAADNADADDAGDDATSSWAGPVLVGRLHLSFNFFSFFS